MAELRQAGHEDLASTGGRPKPTGTQVCLSPTVNVELGVGDITLRLFSLLSTFGTAQDVTTDELRIETFFPADDFTATFFKKLAG